MSCTKSVQTSLFPSLPCSNCPNAFLSPFLSVLLSPSLSVLLSHLCLFLHFSPSRLGCSPWSRWNSSWTKRKFHTGSSTGLETQEWPADQIRKHDNDGHCHSVGTCEKLCFVVPQGECLWTESMLHFQAMVLAYLTNETGICERWTLVNLGIARNSLAKCLLCFCMQPQTKTQTRTVNNQRPNN